MKLIALICSVALAAAISANAADSVPANLHNTEIGVQVLKLFETRDAKAFGDAVGSTNAWNNKRVVASAQHVIDLGSHLKVDRDHVRFHIKDVKVPIQEQHAMPELGIKKSEHPVSFGIRVILQGEPIAKADESLRGEYELALGGAEEYADGWRTYEGIRWIHFPNGVADENTTRELAIIDVVERDRTSLSDQVDPLLKGLGQAFIDVLHSGDVNAFVEKTFPDKEESWAELQKKLADYAGHDRPKKEEFENAWSSMRARVTNSIGSMLAQSKKLGIDFTKAQITLKAVKVAYPSARGGYGCLVGLSGNDIKILVNVSSDQKSATGKPVSGDYVFSAKHVERKATKWEISDKMRLEQYPHSFLDEKELAALEFENYVEEHGAFPRNTLVPDIECTRIDTKEKVKLSDYRGKIVVLDWWATWCSPCQEPMANLQKIAQRHPEWKDKVVVMSVSIDDTIDAVKQHLDKRGWTNTFNLWAGSGGWDASPAKKFRLHGVPTCYILGPDGKVIHSGHPVGTMVENIVTGVLTPGAKRPPGPKAKLKPSPAS